MKSNIVNNYLKIVNNKVLEIDITLNKKVY